MKSKTIQIANQTINYYESQESSPDQSVVFVHGNSASAATYQYQFDSFLGTSYRLIAVDLPGHGLSEAFTDGSQYSIPGYGSWLVNFVKELDALDAVFVGWSLGGHIVLETASELPNAKGFMIFGTPPLGKPPAMEEAFLPNPAMAFTFKKELTEEEARLYVAAQLAPNFPIPEHFVKQIINTDGNARENLAASIGQGKHEDEIQIVKELACPLAILHGKKEALVNRDYLQKINIPNLWKDKIQFIEKSGHSPHWEEPELFNKLLDEFIKHCKVK